MTLKSIEEHNAEVLKRHAELERQYKEGVPTNIACPNCGKAMKMDMTINLTSNPPKRYVFCECGYRTTVY